MLLRRRSDWPDRDARSGPGEAAVGRPVDPDAAGVVGPVEVDLGVVGNATPIEERDGVAAAVQVVAARQRWERRDPVVPVGAAVGRGVEARRTPAHSVVIGAGQVVSRGLRILVDGRLILREAGEVLVQAPVVSGALLLGSVPGPLVKRMSPVAG